MTTFAYKALGTDGRTSDGTLAADSRAAAITELTGRGLHPLEINEDHGVAKRRVAATGRKGRVSARSIESFTRELANLLAGGVPLAKSLSLLKRESSNPTAKYLWGEIHDSVVSGTSLADSMAKRADAFSSVYVAMVRAGEAGGFLDVVLQQISEFRAREQDLKGKIKTAMVYPCVLACLAVGVVIFLLTWFIPKFSGMFAQSHKSLPWLTQGVVAASHTVQHYGLFVALGIVIIVVALQRALKTDMGRRRMERMILGTPLLGQVVAHFALVRFCRMLGTLIGAGVPLITALRTAKEAIGNQTLADTVARAIEEVQRGVALSKSLSNSQQLFPPSVIEMIAVAEETARLDKELTRLSLSYESELDRQLRMLVALAEPLLLFLMAGLIGTIVIAMLLPIFNIDELMQ